MRWVQAERAAKEQAEEDEFRRQTMEKFAEQDRLEQMNAQKRRLKVAQHAREVERLIQQKREMFEAAMVRPQTFCSIYSCCRIAGCHFGISWQQTYVIRCCLLCTSS